MSKVSSLSSFFKYYMHIKMSMLIMHKPVICHPAISYYYKKTLNNLWPIRFELLTPLWYYSNNLLWYKFTSSSLLAVNWMSGHTPLPACLSPNMISRRRKISSSHTEADLRQIGKTGGRTGGVLGKHVLGGSITLVISLVMNISYIILDRIH